MEKFTKLILVGLVSILAVGCASTKPEDMKKDEGVVVEKMADKKDEMKKEAEEMTHEVMNSAEEVIEEVPAIVEEVPVVVEETTVEVMNKEKEAEEAMKMQEMMEKLSTVKGYSVNGFELTADQKLQAKELGAFLSQMYKGATIDITGYTDNTGTDKYNLMLGEKRARAFYEELVKYLDDSIVVRKVNSLGKANSVDTNETAEGRFNNRRVAVTVVE